MYAQKSRDLVEDHLLLQGQGTPPVNSPFCHCTGSLQMFNFDHGAVHNGTPKRPDWRGWIFYGSEVAWRSRNGSCVLLLQVINAMSTPARITTSRPTTTQENFQIRRFALTALSSFVIRVVSHGQGAECGVMIFVFCQPLPAQSGQCLIEPSAHLLPEPRHGGHGLDGCRTKTFPWPRQQ